MECQQDDRWLDVPFLKSVSRHLTSSVAVYAAFWSAAQLIVWAFPGQWIVGFMGEMDEFVLVVVAAVLAFQLLKDLFRQTATAPSAPTVVTNTGTARSQVTSQNSTIKVTDFSGRVDSAGVDPKELVKP